MNTKRELENIDKQIREIKENSEYKRLMIHRKGIKDDQRFKNYSLQLQTLTGKKEQIIGIAASRYTANGRIVGNTVKPAVAGKKVLNEPEKEETGDDDAEVYDEDAPEEPNVVLNKISRRNKVCSVIKSPVSKKAKAGDKFGRVIGKRLKPKAPADPNAKTVSAVNAELESEEIDPELDNYDE